MTDFLSEILLNKQITRDFFRMRFTIPENTVPQPGQFLSLKDEKPTGTLLRRPFAFSDAGNGFGEMIYQTRGQATHTLSRRQPGDRVSVLLPCGNGFPTAVIGDRVPVLIAGGVGLGPVLFLYRTLKAAGKNPLLITGFRTADLIPHSVLPDEAVICTDDGSFGFHGNTAEALRKQTVNSKAVLFSCGPTPMMKAVSAFAEESSFDSFVSLEAMMGCSLGACMGCVVPVKSGGYRRVCKEGPVFDAGEILWTSI